MATATESPVKVGRKPWYEQIGKPVSGTNGLEFLASVGADFHVVKQPTFAYGVGEDSAKLMAAPGMVTMRADNSQIIAPVRDTYQVIQNEVLATLADLLNEEVGGVKVTQGGLLNGSRVVWLVADLPDNAIRIGGDHSAIAKKVIMRTGHDALTSLTLGPIMERLSCANQVSSTVKGLRSKIVFKHTSNVHQIITIEKLRKALTFVNEYYEGEEKVLTALTKKEVTINDVIAFTEKLLPSTAKPAEDGGKVSTTQKHRDSIVALFQNSVDLVDLPMTEYRLFQAVTEFADHERPYRKTKIGTAEEARAAAVIEGTSLVIKDRALNILLPAASRPGRGGRFVSTQVPA